jgi:hypothetical protein
LHQHVALHLHDGGGRGPDKAHQEIVARLFLGVALFLFVKVQVVKRHLDRCTGGGNVVQAHAGLFDGQAEVFVAFDRPAQLQQVLFGVETDAGLVFVVAGRRVDQRPRSGVLPQGLERFLDLVVVHLVTQADVAMDVDLKRRGFLAHDLARIATPEGADLPFLTRITDCKSCRKKSRFCGAPSRGRTGTPPFSKRRILSPLLSRNTPGQLTSIEIIFIARSTRGS